MATPVQQTVGPRSVAEHRSAAGDTLIARGRQEAIQIEAARECCASPDERLATAKAQR
jgi:hypothetical protein